MPVAGEAMIRRIAGWLQSHGVTDLVLNLHHRPETIAAVLGDGSDLGVHVRYSWEQPRLLGSAGGPRLALPLIGADRFFLVNGDTLTDVDLGAMAAAHEASRAQVTLALIPNREFNRYGGVQVDDRDRVAGFRRRGAESEGTWHFVGVQIVEASVFAKLESGAPASTVGGIYDELIRVGPGPVRAFRCDAAFWDVGTAADYLRTSRAFSEAPFDVGRRARIDDTARIAGSVLWDDVSVGANASLTDCIVADGVAVPANARHEHAILMRRQDRLAVFPLDP